jgi:gamma-glutamylaminecyclotransferase
MRLFVYGSLMSGERHHELVCGARMIGATRTAPLFELYDRGDYPALVEPGRTAVRGELYEVDDALLAELDRFEEVPTLYRRASIALAGGEQADAYLLVDASVLRPRMRIASGDWRKKRLKADR